MRSRTTAALARATSRSRTSEAATAAPLAQDPAAPIVALATKPRLAADLKAIAALEAAVAAWNIADGPDEAHGLRWTVYAALRTLLALVLGAWASTAGKVAAYAFDEAARTADEGSTFEEPPTFLDGPLDKPIDAACLRFLVADAKAKPRVEVMFDKYGPPRAWTGRHALSSPTRGLLVRWSDDPVVLAERMTRAVNRHLDAAERLAMMGGAA